VTKSVLTATLDDICELDLPLWRRLELFVEKQREVHGHHSGAPVPATFVLNRGEHILTRRIEPDFGKRMGIEEITTALRNTPQQRGAPRERPDS
jgi:hypothetical protein